MRILLTLLFLGGIAHASHWDEASKASEASQTTACVVTYFDLNGRESELILHTDETDLDLTGGPQLVNLDIKNGSETLGTVELDYILQHDKIYVDVTVTGLADQIDRSFMLMMEEDAGEAFASARYFKNGKVSYDEYIRFDLHCYKKG